MGKPSQDMKCHFKMYKKGKLWLVAGITAASLFAGVHGAKADTTTQVDHQAADKVATATGNANSSNDQMVLSAATASANVAVVTPAVSASAQVSAAPAVSASAQVASASQAVSAATAPASQQAAPVAMYKAAVETTSAQTSAQSSAATTSNAASANSSAAPTTKEVYSGGHWYLQDTATNQYLNGWQSLSGNRTVYYDTTSNQMQYGEKEINNQWYYFRTDNGDVVTGWQKLADGRNVYYDVKKGGNKVTGQGMLHGMQQANGTYYYFRTDNGDREQGFKTNNGKTYYFAPSMTKGEKNINGHWYDFDDNGVMQTGFTKLADGRLDYYNAQGQMQYGEQKINGQWYYFRTDNGDTARGFTKLANGRTVYYDVDANGKGRGMLHGEQTLSNGKTYMFAKDNGDVQKGVIYNNGKLSYFGTDGALVKNGKVGSFAIDTNGYLKLANGENQVAGHWYLYDAKTGTLKTGWQKLADGRTVYYDPQTAQITNGEKNINGHWYYFSTQNGDMAKGLTKLADGRTVYYSTNGQMQYGEQKLGGHWYYFAKDNGNMAKGFTKLADGRTVYYNNDGQMQYGWQKLNNKQYYFATDNGNMYTGTHTIDGKTYTFDNNGVEEAWGWPFPSVGQGYFSGAQRFGVNAGGEFRLNGFHDGLDFGSVDHPGSTVHAIHAGTVKSVGYTAGLDWYVTVDTGEYLVVYQEAFSSRNQIAVKPGQQIGLGDTIGYRNTSHLHIGITRQKNFNVALANSFNNNGTWLNPLDIILNNR